jgi:DNA-binding protein HU-beta
MTREDLAVEVTKKMGGSKKESYAYIDAVLDGIKIGMKADGEVKLNGFGTFFSVLKPSFESRNPKTGEKVTVPDRHHPKIKFSGMVKDYLNS